MPKQLVFLSWATAATTVFATALVAPRASAHHSAGHGASEGVRAVTSLSAQSARASQRVGLLEEVTRTSDQPTGAATVGAVTSLAASFMPHPWFSFGAQFPWAFIDEGATTRHGYGDTTLEALLTPKDDRSDRQVPTFGLRVSLPTRSYELASDPGRIYSASPLFAFTRRYTTIYWQATALTTLESRPAGIAWDASAGLFWGVVSNAGFGAALGAWVDTRLSAHCKSPTGELDYCREGRVTERERPTGATRAYVLERVFYELGDFSLAAGMGLPLTSRRDFDITLSLGLERTF